MLRFGGYIKLKTPSADYSIKLDCSIKEYRSIFII